MHDISALSWVKNEGNSFLWQTFLVVLTMFFKCRVAAASSDMGDSLERLQNEFLLKIELLLCLKIEKWRHLIQFFNLQFCSQSSYQTRSKRRRAPFFIDEACVWNEVKLLWKQWNQQSIKQEIAVTRYCTLTFKATSKVPSAMKASAKPQNQFSHRRSIKLFFFSAKCS